ncbi:putative TIM-barrel fold metal-dependent hydrolase [Arthrobacter sp. GAS37]|uniref:amidohydrolase family protein n=1 Tax=Arthrobacter sp. GAS37 TaxID=3156261 RepID=UPI0038374E4E
MMIDGLVFLGKSHFGYQLDAAHALEAIEHNGASAAIVAPMHPRGGDFAVVNDEVGQAAQDSDGRLVALARVDPWDEKLAVSELRRAVTERGARGVFLHPAEEHFRINDSRVRPIVECAAELGVPVMVATGYHLYSEPVQITQVAQWCPENPLVLTNGGQLNISGMAQFDAELALRNDNVFVQTSGMYREDFLERVVATYGAERLMFATAAPQFNMAYERKRVELAHFGGAERGLIFGGNAKRLFGPMEGI